MGTLWANVSEYKMYIPSSVQRHIGSYTSGAGVKTRKGDRLLGSGRNIGDDMRRCVCDLCVSTDGASQTRCTMFTDRGMKIVERQQTELCKPVCISKSSVRMIQRLIRSLIQAFSVRRTDHEGFLRISLQKEDSSTLHNGAPPSRQPYLFDVDFFDGNLQGSFFASLDEIGQEEHDHFNFAYNVGDEIHFDRVMSSANFAWFKRRLDRALIDGDGKPYSLVIVCDGLPQRDLNLFGISFRSEGHGVFRARPVYLFLQAYSQ